MPAWQANNNWWRLTTAFSWSRQGQAGYLLPPRVQEGRRKEPVSTIYP